MKAPERSQHIEEVEPLTHKEWIAAGADQNDAFLKLLRSLTPAEWTLPTDCEKWTVKDIALHVLGAAEGFTSFRELGHQFVGARRRKRELGTQLDAMNQTQVDDRRHLGEDELAALLEDKLPKFLAVRSRFGGIGKWVPMYDPYLGAINVRYLMDTIFCRDAFMHRIDVARATDRNTEFGEYEARIVADVVREWVRRARPQLRLELTGPAGGIYVLGSAPTATLSGDAIEFSRVLSGRGSSNLFRIEGDGAAVDHWLAVGCPF